MLKRHDKRSVAYIWRNTKNNSRKMCKVILTRSIIADKAENIILVSHGGTLKVFQEILLYSELQEFTEYGRAGSVSFMEIKDNGERIIKRLNDLSYIEGATI